MEGFWAILMLRVSEEAQDSVSEASVVAGTAALSPTWTPKVCRTIAFYRFWAIILPTSWGSGKPKPVLM